MTGFMATGKTTVAKLIAAKLGWEAIDLDELIESEAGCPVSEIFEKFGEKHFRELESRALVSALTRINMVLATGGGVLVREENRKLLERIFVVNLSAPWEEILKRISRDGDTRPLAGEGEERLKEIFLNRKVLYDSIARQVDTAGIAPEEVADRIVLMYEEEK